MQTMVKRALDLFCGAGGATRGLQNAGYHVTGVDLHPQPRYCGDAFYQADAMTFPLDGYDLIWSGPVCKGHTQLNHSFNNIPEYELLIPRLRARLESVATPYVIENVIGAPLPSAVRLCGTSFGLQAYITGKGIADLHRHRLFETSWPILTPPCAHHRGRMTVGFYGDHARIRRRSSDGGDICGMSEKLRLVSEAMGIDWMSWREATQAIPPAFSEYIARSLRMLEVAA